MTGESELIRSSKNFLDAPSSTEDDARIVSQVQVWSLATQGLNLMGFNVDVSVSADIIPSIRRLVIALDIWRADWNEQFGHSLHVGNYPRKGVKLHYHFARLYLCSHAFRGLGVSKPGANMNLDASHYTGSQSQVSPTRTANNSNDDPSSSSQFHPDLEEIAEAAVDSAQNILRIITLDAEIQSHLNGLPLYFDTMIAFAIVFLYKVATRYSKYVKTGTGGTLDLIRNMSRTLGDTTTDMHCQHFLVALAPAVKKLLNTPDSTSGQVSDTQRTMPRGWQSSPNVPYSGSTFLQDEINYHEMDMGLGLSADDFDWASYDLLSTVYDFSGYTPNS